MPKLTISVDFKDLSEEVIAAMKKQVQRGLESIGSEAEGYAKDESPVDSGRLRNSINWSTTDATGTGTDSPLGTPEEYTVYIGTNVEYAVYVEYGEKAKHQTGKAHFLRDAVANHADRYKSIMEASLKA